MDFVRCLKKPVGFQILLDQTSFTLNDGVDSVSRKLLGIKAAYPSAAS